MITMNQGTSELFELLNLYLATSIGLHWMVRFIHSLLAAKYATKFRHCAMLAMEPTWHYCHLLHLRMESPWISSLTSHNLQHHAILASQELFFDWQRWQSTYTTEKISTQLGRTICFSSRWFANTTSETISSPITGSSSPADFASEYAPIGVLTTNYRLPSTQRLMAKPSAKIRPWNSISAPCATMNKITGLRSYNRRNSHTTTRCMLHRGWLHFLLFIITITQCSWRLPTPEVTWSQNSKRMLCLNDWKRWTQCYDKMCARLPNAKHGTLAVNKSLFKLEVSYGSWLKYSGLPGKWRSTITSALDHSRLVRSSTRMLTN